MGSERAAEPSTSDRAATERRVRAMRRRTEERLLEGALRAVVSRGLAKLAMSDVSEFAGVSRGTVYRYFPSTEVLLSELGRREAANFERQVWEAVEEVPSGEERLRVTLEYLAKLAQDHPLVQRLPETDPGFVLTSLRDRFPEIRETFQRLLAAVLEENSLVRRGIVSAEQLAGWTARMMISLFLFPEPDPGETAKAMAAAYQILARAQTEGEEAPGGSRKRAKPGEAETRKTAKKRRV